MGSPRDFVWRANDGAWEMTDFRDFGCISPRFCAFSAGLHGFCTFSAENAEKLSGRGEAHGVVGGHGTECWQMMEHTQDFFWRANDGAREMANFCNFGRIPPQFRVISAGLCGFCTFFAKNRVVRGGRSQRSAGMVRDVVQYRNIRTFTTTR